MVGEAEAFLCRVEDSGEGRMILAEGLSGDEEIVVVGFDEPVTKRRPEVERRKCRDEFEFREGARRRVDRRRFIDRRDGVGGFDVARDRPFRAGRRIVGGRGERERFVARLKVGEAFGVDDDRTAGKDDGVGCVGEFTVDDFGVTPKPQSSQQSHRA